MSTARLLLRPWSPDEASDVASAYDIYRRPEVMRWLGGSSAVWSSLEEARSRLRRWVEVDAERPGYGMWAVVPASVGRPVGTALLAPLPDAEGRATDEIEIGWHLHPEQWGKGYATEAAAALLHHGFETLGLRLVNAVAYAENAASFAVMRRLGMTHRGTTDRWYGTSFEWWVTEAEPAESAASPTR